MTKKTVANGKVSSAATEQVTWSSYLQASGGLFITSLRGNLSSSKLELQQLNYLNLSRNDFGGQPIPEFIGSLNKLRHLDLHFSGIGGRVPYQLGSLLRLQSLGLSSSGFGGRVLYQLRKLSRLQSLDLSYSGLYAGKLEWLSHLSFSRHLRLADVNLTQAVDWLQVISELLSLTEVELNFCNLPSVPSSSSISFVNSFKSLSLLDLSHNDLSNSESIYLLLSKFSSSLVDLDLSFNKLQGLIPECTFSNMTCLQELDLYGNQIDGTSPEAFTNTCNLKALDLGSNNLTVLLSDLLFNLSGYIKHALESLLLRWNMLGGSLPDFSEFISLKELNIRNNQLNAITPNSIGLLFELESLDIFSTSLKGTVTAAHMSNLPQLTYLDLSSNLLLTLKFSLGWVPNFNFKPLDCGLANLGLVSQHGS